MPMQGIASSHNNTPFGKLLNSMCCDQKPLFIGSFQPLHATRSQDKTYINHPNHDGFKYYFLSSYDLKLEDRKDSLDVLFDKQENDHYVIKLDIHYLMWVIQSISSFTLNGSDMYSYVIKYMPYGNHVTNYLKEMLIASKDDFDLRKTLLMMVQNMY